MVSTLKKSHYSTWLGNDLAGQFGVPFHISRGILLGLLLTATML